MKQDNGDDTLAAVSDKLLLTAQRKLLKPRLQNKLILAFVSTALASIAISTYLVIRITAELTENEIERKIQEANSTVLSEIDRYEERALEGLRVMTTRPGFADSLKKEKMSYIFTLPITTGSEAPIGLWVPSGQPAPGSDPPSSDPSTPQSAAKTIMQTEINGIQTLLAGAVMPILEDNRPYGNLAVGYVLGKSFAQDLEIMTGADIRIFFEKISTRPSRIFFKGSSSDLPRSAEGEIKQIASNMLEHPELELIIEGHTDSLGTEKANYNLGLRRAEAVKDALVDSGIAPNRIQTISLGETRAIAPETTEEGEALNRRVELEFKSREDPLVGAIQDLPMTSMIKESIFVQKRQYYDRDALLKGEPYRATYQPLVGLGGKVLGLIFVGMPRKYTFEATVTTWHFFSVILGLGFVLATVLGYTISRSISRPIRHLYRRVLAVADGDLEQHFEAETKDEIGDLGRAFNIMTRKLRQLRELEQEMQRRNRLAALGELSAGVAHEIRNPLGVIKNAAEMLRDRIKDDAKRTELTGYIVEEVERLNRVITDFLQFARPAPPALESVDINEVVGHTISFLGAEPASESVSIESRLGENLPPVLADAAQCHQVFLNLCINAFQAMNGAGTLTVETRLTPPSDNGVDGAKTYSSPVPYDISRYSENSGGTVDIVISDTGKGIPADVLPRIFDPFFSTKDEGAGLGLSLVHKIIENHNGRIRVTSQEGSGTTFNVSLPIAKREKARG